MAMPRFFRTPKGQLLAIFVVLLVIAAPFDGGLSVLPHLAVAIAAACTVDIVYTYAETRRGMTPSSALLSGLIVAFILGPEEPWFSGT
jgi:hypothetical protein